MAWLSCGWPWDPGGQGSRGPASALAYLLRSLILSPPLQEHAVSWRNLTGWASGISGLRAHLRPLRGRWVPRSPMCQSGVGMEETRCLAPLVPHPHLAPSLWLTLPSLHPVSVAIQSGVPTAVQAPSPSCSAPPSSAVRGEGLQPPHPSFLPRPLL